MGCFYGCLADGRLPDRTVKSTSSSRVRESNAAKEEMLGVWGKLLSQQSPCKSMAFPSSSDNFDHLLGSFNDFHALERPAKTVSAQGAVCLARIEWSQSNYTGLFRRSDYCLLRCSSALPTNLETPSKPMMPNGLGSLARSVVMPFVSLKAFREGRGSANLLFGGKKTGQEEVDFFTHCVCTHMTERCSMALWPVLRVFRAYSKYPMQSGLSDFASLAQDGHVEEPRFPWTLTLRPMSGLCRHDTSKNFLKQLSDVEPGTQLYKILACDSPDAALRGEIEQIGVLVTASRFIQSSLEQHLRFRHQLKEEDYTLRPDWKRQLTSSHINFGWEHFAKFRERTSSDHLPFTSWTWEAKGIVEKKGAMLRKTGEVIRRMSRTSREIKLRTCDTAAAATSPQPLDSKITGSDRWFYRWCCCCPKRVLYKLASPHLGT